MKTKIIKMSVVMKVEFTSRAGIKQEQAISKAMLDALRTIHACPCFTYEELLEVLGIPFYSVHSYIGALARIGAIEGCGVEPSKQEGGRGRGKTKWKTTEFGADILGNYDLALLNTKDYIFDGH